MDTATILASKAPVCSHKLRWEHKKDYLTLNCDWTDQILRFQFDVWFSQKISYIFPALLLKTKKNHNKLTIHCWVDKCEYVLGIAAEKGTDELVTIMPNEKSDLLPHWKFKAFTSYVQTS